MKHTTWSTLGRLFISHGKGPVEKVFRMVIRRTRFELCQLFRLGRSNRVFHRESRVFVILTVYFLLDNGLPDTCTQTQKICFHSAESPVSSSRPPASNDRLFVHGQLHTETALRIATTGLARPTTGFSCTTSRCFPAQRDRLTIHIRLFLCDVHRKKFGGKLASVQAENGTHSVYLYHVVYVTYDRCAFYGPSHVFSCKCRMASRYETCE